MEPKILCQSCTMPIDNIVDRGTEKDNSKSSEYCKFCYKNGAFTKADMTFEKMRSNVTIQMQKMNLPGDSIQKSLNSLANLKRWQRETV
jgi:Putative zinc ribbon domain